MNELKTFEGVGSLKPLVDEWNKVAQALSNIRVLVSGQYDGVHPSLKLVPKGQGYELLLNMGDVTGRIDEQPEKGTGTAIGTADYEYQVYQRGADVDSTPQYGFDWVRAHE